MTPETFQRIYFWEWLHRLWGRMIGAVFAGPLLWFWLRGQIGRERGIKLALIFCLGGLQGFIGWFMVQSGLEVGTSVSPYRLALHLGFALLIYALLLSTAVGTGCSRHGWWSLGALAVTIFFGALVAGLHAGEVYNTWPLMDGQFFPAGALVNPFENAALVQFIHRWLGPLTLIAILSWKDRPKVVAIMAAVQVSLGLATLLGHTQIVTAVLHQAGAVTLLTMVVYALVTPDRTNRSRQTETATPHRQSANTTPPPSNRNELAD